MNKDRVGGAKYFDAGLKKGRIKCTILFFLQTQPVQITCHAG